MLRRPSPPQAALPTLSSWTRTRTQAQALTPTPTLTLTLTATATLTLTRTLTLILTRTRTLARTRTRTLTLARTSGTTALLRRFAIDKRLAGGAWLVVERARAARLGASRCAAEFECTAAEVEGQAPDILASAPPDEAWARLPRLSTLAVQVVTTPLTPNPNPHPNPDPSTDPNPDLSPNPDPNPNPSPTPAPGRKQVSPARPLPPALCRS